MWRAPHPRRSCHDVHPVVGGPLRWWGWQPCWRRAGPRPAAATAAHRLTSRCCAPVPCCYPKVRYRTCYQTVVETCQNDRLSAVSTRPSTAKRSTRCASRCMNNICAPSSTPCAGPSPSASTSCSTYTVCKPVYDTRMVETPRGRVQAGVRAITRCRCVTRRAGRSTRRATATCARRGTTRSPRRSTAACSR